MIDHLTLRVADYEKSKAFFVAALKPLGYELLMEWEGFCGLGEGGKPDFWIAQGKQEPAHFAFRANNHAAVDAFHAAALKAGARDNGAPGPREQYHPSFYGAFVIDRDGHNVEACCHKPE
jgi:catechol 2,3-dioxygenase-like lactoylglutathione lyase family enzyme